jgi:AIPR protein
LTYDDKRHEVILELNDHKQHGVVDGAHTLDAIIESQKTPESDGAAYVFIKVLVGIGASQISEIVGGLNTSQQVDLKSLENLREHFSALQEAIASEPYAHNVA